MRNFRCMHNHMYTSPIVIVLNNFVVGIERESSSNAPKYSLFDLCMQNQGKVT